MYWWIVLHLLFLQKFRMQKDLLWDTSSEKSIVAIPLGAPYLLEMRRKDKGSITLCFMCHWDVNGYACAFTISFGRNDLWGWKIDVAIYHFWLLMTTWVNYLCCLKSISHFVCCNHSYWMLTHQATGCVTFIEIYCSNILKLQSSRNICIQNIERNWITMDYKKEGEEFIYFLLNVLPMFSCEVEYCCCTDHYINWSILFNCLCFNKFTTFFLRKGTSDSQYYSAAHSCWLFCLFGLIFVTAYTYAGKNNNDYMELFEDEVSCEMQYGLFEMRHFFFLFWQCFMDLCN